MIIAEEVKTRNKKTQSMDFQTPPEICQFMASFLPEHAGKILEPTPGTGNLVKVLKSKGEVFASPDFFELDDQEKFDWIVMNPPFTPMKLSYKILYRCMSMSPNLIALMPWLTIINSEKRTKDIMEFGLKSITHLPRSIFKGSRVQTCILQMKQGWSEATIFRAWMS